MHRTVLANEETMKLDRVRIAGVLVCLGLGGRMMGRAGGGSVVGSIHTRVGEIDAFEI